MAIHRIRTGLIVHIFFITALFFSSCDNNTNTSTTHAPDSKQPPAPSTEHISVRSGISPTNAYSDLFLDSARIGQFISQQHIDAGKANDIRNFYNNRAYQFAWFTSKGFTEQALAFRSLYDYSKDSGVSRKQLDNRLDELLNTDSLAPEVSDPQISATELLMSWRFINYLNERFPDEKTKYAALTELVPYQKYSTSERIAKLNAAGNIAEKNTWYQGLQKALQQLINIKKDGGWDSLPVSVKLFSKKTNTPQIARLKKRLRITGQLPANDTTPVYTQTLATAIKNAQAQYGFPHDTILTANLLKELNIPVEARIQQLLINMERMRWMPDLPEGKFILVNIPEFKLHVREGNNSKFDMDVIVGKDGHGTVMFSGDLNQIVFSPYWNLPASIVKKEVLPAIKRNKRYLRKEHMEITGQRNGLPVIRQLPGEWNELGRIKFLFPNSLNIYFHDTPHKWLFNKDLRAYSHGCIRLAEPEKLAAYLLQDNPSWTVQRIDSAMNSDKEKYLKLDHPVPVLIYYYTSWMDEAGILQFRKDIYGHDADFAVRLF